MHFLYTVYCTRKHTHTCTHTYKQNLFTTRFRSELKHCNIETERHSSQIKRVENECKRDNKIFDWKNEMKNSQSNHLIYCSDNDDE